VEKYGTARQATDDNIIRRMRFACWITKATDTHSEYLVFIAFSRQQWLRERASVLTVMHTLSVLLNCVPVVLYVRYARAYSYSFRGIFPHIHFTGPFPPVHVRWNSRTASLLDCAVCPVWTQSLGIQGSCITLRVVCCCGFCWSCEVGCQCLIWVTYTRSCPERQI
jgi:hypothetical protein